MTKLCAAILILVVHLPLLAPSPARCASRPAEADPATQPALEPPAADPLSPPASVPGSDSPQPTQSAADAPPAEPAAAEPAAAESVHTPAKNQGTAVSPGGGKLVRLAKDYDLWIDPRRKLVVVDGRVCLREGQLEMFACPRGTKEHESIIAVDCRSQFVHAALLAVGAEPGRPVQFDPEYAPATGSVIDIFVLWVDQQGGRHKVRAQDWVRNIKADKAMQYDWVFAGSGFWTDEQTGERAYYADGGDMICVSNFSTAMLDVPVASPQDNADLLFAAFTDRIPPLGTRVRLVLIPKKQPPDQKQVPDEKQVPEE